MGERRPSEFFRHLENLADSGTGVNKELVMKLWMRRLPSTLNVSLVASCQTDPNILIPMADKIWDTIHKHSVDAVQAKIIPSRPTTASTSDPNDALRAGISELCQQMQTLRMEISELKQKQNFRSRSRQRSGSFSRSKHFNRGQSRDRKTYENCWYHFKFGANARACRPPCNFDKNAGSGHDFKKNL